MTGFEDLDDDVLYVILDFLYLERFDILQSLRLTSSRLKDFVDALANRTVSLVDDEIHERITYRLVERLTDPSDKIRYHVRALNVVDFKGDEDSYCLNTALIADCLRHFQRLDIFNWKCDAPLPLKLLDNVQHRFPRAQFCASVKSIDQTLLSIPQLHRLEVSVPYGEISGDQSISLFRALKQALLHLPSLRYLCLDTHQDATVGRLEGAALDRLQLPLGLGDQLPSLVSLHLRSNYYVFDVDHCKVLLASVDCNTLRSLTIGAPNPTAFFEVFIGNLPRLSYLDIPFVPARDNPIDFRLQAWTNFIARLDNLKELVLRLQDFDVRSGFAKMLGEIHGPSLSQLSLQARQVDGLGPHYIGNIRKFLWKFVKLRSLSMAFPDIRSYHRCPECEGHQWGEPNHFSFVPPLPSLRDVNLSIRAPPSERALYTYINKHAHCAICHLWVTFVERSESQLETLSIRFWRWEMTGRQTCLKEVIYDTTRLRGRLTVRVRHNREIPVVVYKEVWEEVQDRKMLVAFEV
ncbi:hypothetical protein C7974DRAFT_160861 [Boeremia exigua]|uniref:uncharacterized protein n=1 Tax=Boeremia exigua TaxID=749465 RepID=UPI001E8DB807|nr:uncharacterized protein C7974DRAFT_160861 [Boeremia exigua]KAH6638451.1 hypothetical protein C7974DRAFT_160861 [Boeremia exigua]